ncbi:YeeE/YedE thiosulfate transporter family protein [Tenacibaculum sp. nBUS_03]|uniref:YeeE/YedE thiosulfate transporter family protein n=1 Tax=Tenacibaculum sp. nBUS_03 TaxID=3395320 RepID=UPI003EBDCB57
MKYIKFLLIGIFFGIILTKSEAISWFRIYEMFKFQSFHMYGIIATAITFSSLFIYLFKKGIVKDFYGNKIMIKTKRKGFVRTLVGGTIFGLGWALAGACPGPIFVLIGYGAFPIVVVLFGAVMGAFLYGKLNDKLPN